VGHDIHAPAAPRIRSGNFGLSTIPVVLLAIMPKCPLCWIALMGTLGVGSIISTNWLQPLAVGLLLLPLSALLARARRRGSYAPFFLGLLAAVALYVCKFSLNYEPGVYLSMATLFAASVWNSVAKNRRADEVRCRC
jgi:hypothetical protein